MAAITKGCALQQQMERKQLLCRFHVRGACRDGERCQFSHDANASVSIPEDVCWYYLRDHCVFGENCRFCHVDPASILSSHQLSSSPSNTQCSPVCPQSVTPQPVAPQPPPAVTQSHVCSTSSSIIQQLLLPTLTQQTNNNNNNNSIISDNVSNNMRPLATQLPQLVPFNKFSLSPSLQQKPAPQQQKPVEQTVPQTQPNNTCTTSPNTSLITDSRQSSEDSGFNEPTSSSNCGANVKTYASVAQVMANNDGNDTYVPPLIVYNRDVPLCEYAINSPDGCCPYPDGQCHYLHGDICDLCGRCCLHPYDIEQQKQHRDECIKEHEREMEISFAIQRSLDKACGICMDIVIEKEILSERRFGILEKCSHIFCISCIRKWRQTKQFDNRTIRACPECRVPSDFVIPSKYWYDDKEEKQHLIDTYKKELSTKPCKYFKQGQGECPFAGACFYLHAYPDGRKAEMPPPRARRRQNHDGQLETLRDMLLWNYLEVRDDNHWLLTLDLEDVFDIHDMGLMSGYETDDESDLSDYADNLIG